MVHCKKVNIVLCGYSFLIASTYTGVIPHPDWHTPGAQLIENLQHRPSQFQLSSLLQHLSSLLQHISLGKVVHILKSDEI